MPPFFRISMPGWAGLPLTLIVAIVLTLPGAAGAVSIGLVGEVIVGQGLQPLIDQKGPGVLFAGIQDILHETDMTVAILGCSLGSQGERRPGVEHAFRAPAALARGLAHAGIRYVSLASPHLMDYGPASLEETLRLLAWYGVTGFGAGLTLAEARKPLVETFPLSNGEGVLKVGLLAYYHGGQFADAYADGATPGLVPATWSVMEKDVPAAKAEVDFLLVWIHWGIVPDPQISTRQRLFAHRLIELGADGVVGQKAHLWQGMEIYQGKPIFYSLADLFFDNYSRQVSRIVIPQLLFEGKRLRTIRLVPVLLEPENMPYQPQPLPKEMVPQVLETYQRMSPGVPIVLGEAEAIVEFPEP